MNELKQILKWGALSMLVLFLLPLLLWSVGCKSSCCTTCFPPCFCIAYLLILLTVIILLIISMVGAQRRLTQEKAASLQQSALDKKFAKESERINAKVRIDERERKWSLEDEARKRTQSLEDEKRKREQSSADNALKRTQDLEDEKRKREWKIEDDKKPAIQSESQA